MQKIILLFSFLCYVSMIHAQEHRHEHARNEIGIGSGALYSIGHKEWGVGTHAHYFRTLTLHSKWSLGGSLEQVWGIGSHLNVSAGIKYQLFERLSLALYPGVTFFSHKDHLHKKREARYTTHFELIYDLFHWEHFHIGTVLDYSLTKGDSHIALGLHAAFCF